MGAEAALVDPKEQSAAADWGTMELASCPLCGSGNHTALDVCIDTLAVEINRYLPEHEPRLPRIENHRRRCSDCGLVFLSPRLNEPSLARLYRLWYGYAYQRIVGDPGHVADRRREFERYHLRQLGSVAPAPGRLLDIGCGTGIFLHVAAGTGWQGIGIELDPATAEVGRKQGLEIRTGVPRECLQADERFEAITMFDYLEHSTAPGDDLDMAVARLAPGGVILVRVPNLAGWQSRWMGCSWLAVISNHLSYFTPEVLRTALERRGLRIVAVDAQNYSTEVDIVRGRWNWARGRLAHLGKSSRQGPATSTPVPTHGCALARLGYSLFIEQLDHIAGWFGKGNNLMAIASRV